MPAEPIFNMATCAESETFLAGSDGQGIGLATACPIQVEGLMARCMNRPSFAALILHELDLSATELINKLEPLVDAGDCLAAIGPIHSLKGASAIAGAEALSRIAGKAELAARSGDSVKLQAYLPIISQEWNACKLLIPDIVSSL